MNARQINGWLSREGVFTKCNFMQHETVSYAQFGMSEKAMYKEGFVKLFTAFGYTEVSPTRFLSSKQKAWLKDNNIEY